MMQPFVKLAVFLCALAGANAWAGSATISVAAGEIDRRDTPTYFTVPESVGSHTFRLRDAKGTDIPVQMDVARRSCFILPELKAGQSLELMLEGSNQRIRDEGAGAGDFDASHAIAIPTGSAIKITLASQDVLSYQGGKTTPPDGVGAEFQRSGYIFPLFTPSGKQVLDDYPHNHKHHHGIWAPWTKTEFEGRHPDFWNMGGKSAMVEATGQPTFFSGRVFAGIDATLRHVDLGIDPPKAALNETWSVRVYKLGASDTKYRIFDFTSTQTCASDSPLKLVKYHYGGLGVRGSAQWNYPAGSKEKNGKYVFLSADGKGVKDGNETRSKWCHLGGLIDGQPAGLAILDHPTNFRHPQPMRLNPQEPFFCYAPSQLGDWEIKPGEPYVARYRFVVYDGEPNVAELNRLWQDYATPPVVTVK